MSTYPRASWAGWIGVSLLLASASVAASQTRAQGSEAYPQRDQQQILDQLRVQRQLSDQRLGDDLRRQQQGQDIRRQQIEIEDRIRRQQLQDQIDRQRR
jgi:hypothetical protein